MSDSGVHYVGAPGVATPKHDAVLDVLFVHGLTGDPMGSWTHDNGEYWPRWLAEECPAANVFSIAYGTTVWSDFTKGSGVGLISLGSLLLDLLVSKCGTSRPLVFICHSLGGLAVKQILRTSAGASNGKKKSVAPRTKAVIFIATPHQGATFAKSVKDILGIATSKIADDLAHGDDKLIELGTWFSNWAPETSVEVASYYEIQKYKGLMIVDQMTANPNVHGCDPAAIDADHVSIAKPADREAHIYCSVKAIIEDALQKLSSAAPARPSSGWQEEVKSEFEALTVQATEDRRSLAEKLTSAGRAKEVSRAEAMKERFSMELQRHIAQPSAVSRYARLMSSVEGRFHRYATPAISEGKSVAAVNHVIQQEVIDPLVAATASGEEAATSGQVESAIYYLAGNCHLDWDNE